MTQSDESALKGVAEVADIIDLFEVLRPTYYNKPPSPGHQGTQSLYKKTTALFKDILAFQASAARFLSKGRVMDSDGDALLLLYRSLSRCMAPATCLDASFSRARIGSLLDIIAGQDRSYHLPAGSSPHMIG